jgi:hypothetical protein
MSVTAELVAGAGTGGSRGMYIGQGQTAGLLLRGFVQWLSWDWAARGVWIAGSSDTKPEEQKTVMGIWHGLTDHVVRVYPLLNGFAGLAASLHCGGVDCRAKLDDWHCGCRRATL